MRFRLRPPGGDQRLYAYWDCLDQAGAVVDSGSGWHDLTERTTLSTRRITIRVDGYLPVELPVAPEVGKTVDLGDVPLDPGATVRVRAVDADGHPLKMASMSVLRAGDDDTTLADGIADDDSFVARGVPFGPARVQVAAPGFLPATVEIEAAVAAPVVTVTLKRGAVLRVRVVDADGFVKQADSLVLRDPGGVERDDSLYEETPGTWIGRLPAGRFHVTATSGDVTIESDVELADGATKEITLKFARK